MRFARGNAHGVNGSLVAGDAHVGGDGAEFLRQPGLVEHRHALLFDVSGHAEYRADGENAGATDAGDEDVKRTFDLDALRFDGFWPVALRCALAWCLRNCPPWTVTKLGQNPRTQE